MILCMYLLQFIWQQYLEDTLSTVPWYYTTDRRIWPSVTHLICWQVVKAHLLSQVLQEFEFEFEQHVPQIVLMDTQVALHSQDWYPSRLASYLNLPSLTLCCLQFRLLQTSLREPYLIPPTTICNQTSLCLFQAFVHKLKALRKSHKMCHVTYHVGLTELVGLEDVRFIAHQDHMKDIICNCYHFSVHIINITNFYIWIFIHSLFLLYLTYILS